MDEVRQPETLRPGERAWRGRGAVAPLRPGTLLLVVLLAACVTGPPGLQGGRWVDLTHAFGDDTIVWPTGDPFVHEMLDYGPTEGGTFYASARFAMPEHGGTHLDAPIHFAEGRRTVDRIPVDQLMGPAVVVDVSEAAQADADYRVVVNDLRSWEARHGEIPDGAIVLLRTGYGQRWPDAERYLGTAERGAAAARRLHFPGLHPEAARWLVAERRVGAVGIDTASIDHGPSRTFRSHVVLFEHDVPALENVARLEDLPPKGAWVLALPMKIRSGTGAPLRIVAWVP